MMTTAFRTALTLAALAPTAALAGPATDALSSCLVRKTTGEDRMDMVRWMTLAFAAHPSVKDAVTILPDAVQPADMKMAALVTDLLVERCPDETRAAVAEAGSPAIALQVAFEVLGGAAAQEAMAAPEVNQAVLGFSRYLDEGTLAKVLQ